MKLLLDLQCVQSSSSLRGIGRYSLCLARAVAQTAGSHSVGVLLNGGDSQDRLLRARVALESFLPARDIHVFEAAWPFSGTRTAGRRLAAEAARSAAVRSLQPDVLLVASIFEGDVENVCSVDGGPHSPPTAALLFDLIPAADPGTYLLGPGADDYWRRFEDLRRADLLLSISDYSADQARALMVDAPPAITTIWGGPYESGAFPAFERRLPGTAAELPGDFLLAVGGDHPRKNLDRLVRAWGLVPQTTRRRCPLVIACSLNPGTVRRLWRLAAGAGVAADQLLLLGEVSEDHLGRLYETARGFVFPSTEEGLGMPPLEAMARGCPTALARSSSLVELADDPEAYFDPEGVRAIGDALVRLAEDADHRERLRQVARRSAATFTWRRSAQLAWAALEQLVEGSSREAGRPIGRSHVVESTDVRELTRLPDRPRAVRVDPALAVDLPPDASGTDAERLGLAGTARPGLRELLQPATALLVDDEATGRDVVAAGLLDQPLVAEGDLDRALRHDPVEHLRELLHGLALPPETGADVVAAAARAPRWTLERPAPVVLCLRRDWSTPPYPAEMEEAASSGHLVLGGPVTASLADRVDLVLVERELAVTLGPTLHHARTRGARIRAVGPPQPGVDVPAWLAEEDPAPPEDWHAALQGDVQRRTGWPWLDGA